MMDQIRFSSYENAVITMISAIMVAIHMEIVRQDCLPCSCSKLEILALLGCIVTIALTARNEKKLRNKVHPILDGSTSSILVSQEVWLPRPRGRTIIEQQYHP